MVLTVGDRPVRPLTADEVQRMVEAGILAEDERVELLHGVLTAVSPKSPAHGVVMSRLFAWLGAGASAGLYAVRTEHPLIVPDTTSLPEPDVAVVELDETTLAHPTTALLVIEVAITSIRTDTTIKPALYAAAGVPELWVIDVANARLERFSAPRRDGFASCETLTPPVLVQPKRVPVEPLDVAALLAGL
jgi:Uma2 family endonuclease